MILVDFGAHRTRFPNVQSPDDEQVMLVIFAVVHCFFQTSGHFLHPLKQQSIKKQCGYNIYYSIQDLLDDVFKIFLTLLFLL